ncbi:unnamed protein product [Vitrella brassicaformis CCMP3155]|uniref:TLDc domain-containing protein n=2 Tax=Vitrella brassicaformis TaxID=1169539 RepID=A0A0G4F6H3_VITBC|nr:unnamed protein product [Vitrella brassicaformis CCMP3155]|mmetsp:Transcript_39446/g.98752  ORF Transcript_39446/g.98752 Transcript_39446/m.98752 type:complete len:470 (+) Transcript_39446:2-1411(+)|eukprot:CEM08013.1 unnamed protein product [Vitrella brassicaformis CCMP3155]
MLLRRSGFVRGGLAALHGPPLIPSHSLPFGVGASSPVLLTRESLKQTGVRCFASGPAADTNTAQQVGSYAAHVSAGIASRERTTLADSITSLRRKIKALDAKLTTTTAEMGQIHEALGALRDSVQSLHALRDKQPEDHSGALDQLETTVTALKQKVQANDMDIKQMGHNHEMQIGQMREDLDTLRDCMYSSLEKQPDDQREVLEQLKMAVSALQLKVQENEAATKEELATVQRLKGIAASTERLLDDAWVSGCVALYSAVVLGIAGFLGQLSQSQKTKAPTQGASSGFRPSDVASTAQLLDLLALTGKTVKEIRHLYNSTEHGSDYYTFLQRVESASNLLLLIRSGPFAFAYFIDGTIPFPHPATRLTVGRPLRVFSVSGHGKKPTEFSGQGPAEVVLVGKKLRQGHRIKIDHKGFLALGAFGSPDIRECCQLIYRDSLPKGYCSAMCGGKHYFTADVVEAFTLVERGK